jgi:pimeloyl-ACP methyl ester carboxylesterase
MKICIVLLFSFFYTIIVAQKPKVYEIKYFPFSNEVNVTQYQGMKFELSSNMKVDLFSDSSGGAQMWARVNKVNGYGFFENMDDRKVVKNKWETYIIKGQVDSGATKLFFGGIVNLNGVFYYDNFKLKIETPEGWKNIEIPNSDFESVKQEGWNIGKGKNPFIIKGYKAIFVKESIKNTILKIAGNGVENYGNNKLNGKYFETNGVKLYYEIYGKGEPLLLLHGNGQSIEALNRQIDFFKNKYKVIVPDCRGRGKSTDSEAELTYDIQAIDMSNLLNYLKVDSANIIGWSDGGIIGLLMAKDYPNKVKKLIASGANVLQDTTAYFPKDYNRFMEQLVDTTFKGMQRKLINLMVQYPSVPFEDLGKIKCPTLIVAGDNDEIRIGHTIKIFEAIKRAQLFIVPKTSHYVLSENHEVFNLAALKFLKEK